LCYCNKIAEIINLIREKVYFGSFRLFMVGWPVALGLWQHNTSWGEKACSPHGSREAKRKKDWSPQIPVKDMHPMI
jgi:hypothetical protein